VEFTSLTEYERIEIIDKMVLDGMRSVQRSSEADDFVEQWMAGNGIPDDSARATRFRDRTLPNWPDFALVFFQTLCKRNNIDFSGGGRFNESDYRDENDELYFPIYSKRTIEGDIKKLKLRLLENNINDELKNDIKAAGYYYDNKLGIGLSTIDRNELKLILDIVGEIGQEAKKLKAKNLKNKIKELQRYIGDVGEIDINKYVSYEEDNASTNIWLGQLLNAIIDRKSCLLTRVTNEKKKFTELISPVYLRQVNNRWYLLYFHVENNEKIIEYLKEDWYQPVLDLGIMCPLDQILTLDEGPVKVPKNYLGLGQMFFDNVFGAQRPRSDSKVPIEEVIFKVSKADPSCAFLIKRLYRERMFPNLELKEEDEEYKYFSARFYVTDDAVNKIMSYQPKLIVEKGEDLMSRINQRIKKINELYNL
jgi:hypothetical protein